MVKTTWETNKFNNFIGCDLIGSMLVSAILPLGFTADDIKKIILIDMYMTVYSTYSWMYLLAIHNLKELSANFRESFPFSHFATVKHEVNLPYVVDMCGMVCVIS